MLLHSRAAKSALEKHTKTHGNEPGITARITTIVENAITSLILTVVQIARVSETLMPFIAFENAALILANLEKMC